MTIGPYQAMGSPSRSEHMNRISMGFSPASMVTVSPAAILERAETTLVRIACRQLHPDAGSLVPRLVSCYYA